MQTALTAVHAPLSLSLPPSLLITVAARAERIYACIYLRVHLCTTAAIKYEDYTLLWHYGLCYTHGLCGFG